MLFLRPCFTREISGHSPTFGRVFASTSWRTCQPTHTKLNQRLSHSLPLRERIPPKSWDSHMHVVDPKRYPVAPNAAYIPPAHTIKDALAFEASLGIENIVLVQPSIYGFDNSCLLDALKYLGPLRGRGVMVIDPTNVKPTCPAYWHSLGVRGLRVNLKSVGKEPTKQELEKILRQHADIARPLGWMIQIHLEMHMIPMLVDIAPQLGVKLCIDHFGCPQLVWELWRRNGNTINPYNIPGFDSLLSLLHTGNTYVKLSAPYRLGQLRDIKRLTKVLLHEAPNQVIFATDWPHTRYARVDIVPFTEMCLKQCERRPGLAERLFRLNAETLMDDDYDDAKKL